jgi:hypothetical protein
MSEDIYIPFTWVVLKALYKKKSELGNVKLSPLFCQKKYDIFKNLVHSYETKWLISTDGALI